MAVQYQVGGFASISSITAPRNASPGELLVVGVLVVNNGDYATILAQMKDFATNTLLDQQYIVLNPGQSEFFQLTATMGTQPTVLIIEAGHTAYIDGVVRSFVDSSATAPVEITGTRYGKIPPYGANRLIEVDVVLPAQIAGLESRLLGDLTTTWGVFQGWTVLKVDVVPEVSKVLIWVASNPSFPFPPILNTGVTLPITYTISGDLLPSASGKMGALGVVLTLVFAAVLVFLVVPRVLDIIQDQQIIVQRQQAIDLTRMANEMKAAILADPTLTSADKAAAIAGIDANLKEALKRPIPWTLLAGTAIVGTLVVGTGLALSSGKSSVIFARK